MAEVFLMEDEPNISFVVKTVLTDEGHHVTAASNGIVGLETLVQSDKPDILLLDLNLPGLSGAEIAKTLRGADGWENIPIVIMSGCVEENDAFPPKECYDSVLTKPFNLSELTDIVNRLTQKTDLLLSCVQQP